MFDGGFMNKIRKIGVFGNNNEYSMRIYNELISKLKTYGYIVDNSDFDLGIAIGGDGAFIRMIRRSQFDSRPCYLGVNTGTLGFAQEIYPVELDNFLQMLKEGNYKIENISVQETKVKTKEDEAYLQALNEIIIRDSNLRTTHLNIRITNNILEKFVGDGILIATSFGSSAHNLSVGGSIVYNELPILQITPMGPINNKSYRTLDRSVIIPEERHIFINPGERNPDLLLTVDAENYFYHDVESLETSVKKEKIKCLRMHDYDYTRRIYEKFVK